MNKELHKKAALIWRFLKGSKRFFLLSIIFTCINSLTDMAMPQLIRCTVDNVMGGAPAKLPAAIMQGIANIGGFEYLKANLWIMALAVIAVASVKVASQYFFRVCNTKATETLSKTTRDSLFSHIIKLPYSWHIKNQTGDIIQRCTSDIATMNGFVSEELTVMFRIVVTLLFSLIFMLKMHTALTLIALSLFPVIIINSILFDRKVEENFQKFDLCEARVSATVQENLTGARVVRAFGQESSELKKFRERNEMMTVAGKQTGRVFGIFCGVSDILAGCQIMLVIICGAAFCIRGGMTAGEYIAFVSYNTMLAWPLNELGRTITNLGKTSVSIDRIRYIMEADIEKAPVNALMPPLDKDISFENVAFAYGDAAPILKNISFTMKTGSTLGILGGTGSGKSTLVLLLDKLYALEEGHGSITIGGVDIKDIDTSYLRKNIGMVLQDPYLFSRSIAENIGMAGENVSQADIEAAAKAACIDASIKAFAKGYDTCVGERGVTLSGGQKQRVAIAQVLMQNKPIMIFDDSLSAVDTETDAAIRASLEKRFGSASIILISHRITTLAKADKIIVIENGRVAEQGTHAELISGNGIYRKIYDIQTAGREEAQ